MKKVRLAVIGCGGFVQSHMAAIDDHVKGFDCVGLADTVEANAQRLVDKYKVCKRAAFFTDHREMLKATQPEAVIVSTPHTLHYRHAYDALIAGAHVMIEKPMVTDSGDARRLVSRAKQKDRVLQIAVQGTYTDTFSYARKLLTDGTMGELQLVTGVMAQGWLEGTRGRWRQEPALSGGGQLYDSTAHVLSAMVYLVNSPVKEVFCFADNKGTKVDINAVGVVRFANGAMATITSGGNCAAWKSLLLLQGANALMQISAHGGDFNVSGRDLKEPITAPPKSFRVPTVTPAKNFYDAIRGKAQPRCAGRIGIILADLMDALYASVATGKVARVTRRMPAE